jgi:cell division protein ZapA
MSGKKTVVKVSIVGEEYAIRTDTSAEHTRAVAEYVDRTIRAVLSSGGLMETRKAAILAALQITDELFQARQARAELAELLHHLSGDVRRWLPPAKRTAAPPGSASATLPG